MTSPIPSRKIYGMIMAIGLSTLTRALFADTAADFQVEIKERIIFLSGSLPDEPFAREIQSTLTSACPNHTVSSGDIVFAAKPGFPSLADLRPLLAELGISTMEGRLEIWPDRIVLGGLTDSQVTLSALTVRLRSLLTTRRLVNHLCIVPTDDLPKPALLLADTKATAGSGDSRRRRSTTFEPSGVGVQKLPGLINLLAQVEIFAKDVPANSSTKSSEPLRAAPIETTAAETATTDPVPPASMPLAASPVLPPGAGNSHAPVGMILFSRNTALYQGNQDQNLANLLSWLNSPTFQGQAIRLEAIKASGASAPLLDYLCERRLDEATTLLTNAGIDKSLISRRTTSDDTAIDSGEVRVTAVARELPTPPPPDPSTGAPAGSLPSLQPTPPPLP
jgi:hypothetical protein